MNKSEQRETAKAKKLAAAGKLSMAANTLAIIYRAALTMRSKREILAVISAEGLTNFLKQENGTLVLQNWAE